MQQLNSRNWLRAGWLSEDGFKLWGNLMKILSWNIRFGGQQRVDGILSALARHDADIIILTEYQPGSPCKKIHDVLAENGWPHQSASDVPKRQLGVLIASKFPMENASPFFEAGPEPFRVHKASVEGITVVGAYLPYEKYGTEVWDHFCAEFGIHQNEEIIVMGDFNAGIPGADFDGSPLQFSGHFSRLGQQGLVDVWRSRNPDGQESTWVSNTGNGFRLDHAFATKSLNDKITNAFYVHEERENRLSDHSLMIVEIK